MALVTVPKAQEILGISKKTIKKHHEQLGGKKIGTRIYFDEETLHKFAKQPSPLGAGQ